MWMGSQNVGAARGLSECASAQSGRRSAIGSASSNFLSRFFESFSLLPASISKQRNTIMASTTRPQYIVEHMEEDDPDAPSVFPRWALLEYGHMLSLLGPGTTLHFTSLSLASLASLQQQLGDLPQPRAEFELHTKSFQSLGAELAQICLLDPAAPLGLSVADAGIHQATSSAPPPKPSTANADEVSGGPFTHFLFGGILGDDPPRDRTSSLRKLGMPRRHLGGVQMTTDTALGVTKKVVEDGLALNLDGAEREGPKGKMEWCDQPELRFGRGESVSTFACSRCWAASTLRKSCILTRTLVTPGIDAVPLHDRAAYINDQGGRDSTTHAEGNARAHSIRLGSRF